MHVVLLVWSKRHDTLLSSKNSISLSMTGTTDGSFDGLCQQATAATTRDYRLSYTNMVIGDLRVLRIDRPLSRAKYYFIIIIIICWPSWPW